MKRVKLLASSKQIQAHLNALCRDIGTRIAATKNEQRAADYVARCMTRIGLSNVTQQRFPFTDWGYDVCELLVHDGQWRAVKCTPVVQSPSTPPKGIEAEVVYVDSGSAADLKGRNVKGKILLIWGAFGETTEKLARLGRCGAAALMWVDTRLPFHWPVAMGVPYDWRRHLTVPQVCIPYLPAWRLAQSRRPRARLRIKTWTREAESLNVFGDLPGRGREMAHVGGHMDTVMLGTGADDDASGVAATLEVARLLADLGQTPRRTIRFLAYGAEEQLSEGSRQYVLVHRDAAKRTRLCVNFDAIGSIAGQSDARVVGGEDLMKAVRRLDGGLSEVKAEVCPYSDMFAFNISGAPSVWFYRTNMPNMRFFHHSAHDDLK
ncbi:MAG: M20/M25/M40 family metallo-hydrolase, partial [Planctomycetes bacterium]|nr:M20/M25/M40 family metallo-hydrolase [Planctomycetota bacterium]